MFLYRLQLKWDLKKDMAEILVGVGYTKILLVDLLSSPQNSGIYLLNIPSESKLF
jgi:hypothetical protein